jgi:diaminopimelate decarboxylase
MERVFGTLQQRLPPELRRVGMSTMAAANGYLREVFVPDYNARFGKPAAEPGTAFVAYAGPPLADVLCVQAERQVARYNCVHWGKRALQIPPQRHRHHYVKATHAQQDVGAHARCGPVADRADIKIDGLQAAEGAFDP